MIYKGRFNQIEKGEISNENLVLLANNLLKKDCVNFDIDNVGLGFTSALADDLIKYIPEDKNTNILIINGITLELYNILKGKGYDNITLAFGSWNKEKQNYIDSDKDTFEIMREYIQNNFEDNINVIKLEEIFDMGKKFDLIISNPPYAIGNEITKAIIDNVDFDTFVNLMPVSKYKSKELYKNVSSIQSTEDTFEDAAVGDSLTVAVLKKDANVFESYQELEFMKMDPQYVEFYRLNSRIHHYAISDYERTPHPSNIKYNYDSKKAFAIMPRSALDGVHMKQSFDREFNLDKTKTILDTPIWKNSEGKLTQSAVGYIYFGTVIEKENMCQFWYRNPLMNSLLKGLNQSGGCFHTAIPNIDWSKERDYEHLTLDDIMNILREENPDVA